jgi:hypothetical protein
MFHRHHSETLLSTSKSQNLSPLSPLSPLWPYDMSQNLLKTSLKDTLPDAGHNLVHISIYNVIFCQSKTKQKLKGTSFLQDKILAHSKHELHISNYSVNFFFFFPKYFPGYVTFWDTSLTPTSHKNIPRFTPVQTVVQLFALYPDV